MESTHIVRMILADETLRLFHINLFQERPTKEGIRDIQLLYGPIKVHYHSQNYTYSRWLNNRTEGVHVAHSTLLLKPFCNQPGLESFNHAINFLFDFIDLFILDHIVLQGPRAESSSAISDQGIILLRHSSFPMGIRDCFRITRWFSGRNSGKEGCRRVFS